MFDLSQELSMGGKDASYRLGPHSISDIKVENLLALKDRTKINENLFRHWFQNSFESTLHLAHESRVQFVLLIFFSVPHFKKCPFTTSRCRRQWARFVSRLTYSYQVSYTLLSLPPPFGSPMEPSEGAGNGCKRDNSLAARWKVSFIKTRTECVEDVKNNLLSARNSSVAGKRRAHLCNYRCIKAGDEQLLELRVSRRTAFP